MTLSVRRTLSVSLFIAAQAVPVAAQTGGQSLTIEAIYDPAQRVDFSGSPVGVVRWLDADTYVQARRGAGSVAWVRVDATSGTASPLFDREAMETALAALPGLDRDVASRAARSNSLTFNPTTTGVLLTLADDLFFYDFTTGAAARLTNTEGTEEVASFSPDGRRVAFVRGNDLHVVDLATQEERALTTDGGPEIFNGKLDWLYQEEIYGRGNFRGYWWSPDSTRLAFLRLDETPVPAYTVVDTIPYRPTVEVTNYPKAGDPNPLVRLGVARATGGAPHWIDLGAYADEEILIVDVGWEPSAASVLFQVQDREQTWLDLVRADHESGEANRLLRETTEAWVNNHGSPIWLEDGSFLWLSERSGFKHLYHYQADGTELGPVTEGRWDVRTFYGVDEATGVVYFAAGARRHVDTDIYRVGLDGAGLTRVSRTDGTHRATFNPTFTHYVDAWSDVTTPVQVRLHRADGTEVRVIDANPVPALDDYRLSTPEFVEVPTRDGFVMDALLIKPPDFDPDRQYPVYQYTYAGPTSALVRNQWGGTTYLFHQLLAQEDVIVWVLDNRSASGKGVEAAWPVYGRLGELELRDLEDGVAWLVQQPWVDPARIILSGWSYGGYMTAYALTHSERWSAGIAGGPVTDWRNYDTVYTERFMKTPQNNPEGYRQSAPRFAAADLHGRLLLVHGGIDDNVHLQNTEQLAYELQRAGKPFELMIYPRSRHGVTDPRLNLHLRRMMFDFVLEETR